MQLTYNDRPQVMRFSKRVRILFGAAVVYLILWILTALIGTASARRHVLGIIAQTIPADIRGRYVLVEDPERTLRQTGRPEYWYFATAYAPCPFFVRVRFSIYGGWGGRYYVLWLFGYDRALTYVKEWEL